ncbi:MAG: type I asparaginase [Bacteroidales bacterium]|nr:type I asparaginase [Bacteroidales bacterium]
MEEEIRLLIIYTGGTIGMIQDPQTGTLKPFNFEKINEQIPELSRFNYQLDFHSFDPLIDSSNTNPEYWIQLASLIEQHYESYDGFVVLHGSDTMSYTASAMSFMLENLNKPVIFTGSQLPLGVLRTDGKENFITAIELAAAREDDLPVVPEVCIYFENHLMRANRTLKYNAENFNAFISPNYPLLAEVGVYVKFEKQYILKPNFKKLKVHKKLDNRVGILKLFPGIRPELVHAVLSVPDQRAVILETFGAGNATTEEWFLNELKQAVAREVLLVNVTQCMAGTVEQGKYDTSFLMKQMGVISGYDCTTEAVLAKLMFLLGQNLSMEQLKKRMNISLRGEMSVV